MAAMVSARSDSQSNQRRRSPRPQSAGSLGQRLGMPGAGSSDPQRRKAPLHRRKNTDVPHDFVISGPASRSRD
jgi:hypothetical protein